MAEWPPIPEGAGYPLVDAETGEFLSSLIKAWYASRFVGTDRVVITAVAAGWNFKAGHPDNRIAPDLLGSIIGGDGTPGRENVIGNGIIENVNTPNSNVPANPADLLEPDPNERANHCFCVGYDNVLAGLKGVCLADHSYIRRGASHCSILGGACHGIDAGDFNVISGGYLNFIRAGDYCSILGGRRVIINVPGGGNATAAGGDIEVTGTAGTAFGSFSKVTGTGGVAIGVEAIAADGAAIGNKVTASGIKSFARGNLAVASGNYSRADGNQVTASADGAVAEGVLSQATAAYSTARGLQAVARVAGEQAFANGAFATAGDAQMSNLLQRGTTTTAAQGFLAGYLLNPGQSVQYRIMLEARDTADGYTKAWELRGAAKRLAAAAPVAVGGAFPPPTVIVADAGAAAWTCVMSISGNSLVVLLTGEAAKTVRWVGRIELVELGV